MLITCPDHLVLLDLTSAASCHILPLRSKYSSQHPALTRPWSMSFPWYKIWSFTHPYQTNDIILLYILIIMLLHSMGEDMY
jgi:hypothetical protein